MRHGKQAARGCTLWDSVQLHMPDLDSNGCRIWRGWIDSKGYAKLKHRKQGHRLNRVVLEHKLGRPIRPGYMACHRCNNRACIEESHLYEGSAVNNMQDRIKSGAGYSMFAGEGNPTSKLSVKSVRFIKHSSLPGVTLAAMFDVTPAAISAVRCGKNWSYVK